MRQLPYISEVFATASNRPTQPTPVTGAETKRH